MKYKIIHDKELNLSPVEKAESYRRMACSGTWDHSRDWWKPHDSLMNHKMKIEREGFIILETK